LIIYALFKIFPAIFLRLSMHYGNLLRINKLGMEI
jgi:hypothetical protein